MGVLDDASYSFNYFRVLQGLHVRRRIGRNASFFGGALLIFSGHLNFGLLNKKDTETEKRPVAFGWG